VIFDFCPALQKKSLLYLRSTKFGIISNIKHIKINKDRSKNNDLAKMLPLSYLGGRTYFFQLIRMFANNVLTYRTE
jgi:hypothetical protein